MTVYRSRHLSPLLLAASVVVALVAGGVAGFFIGHSGGGVASGAGTAGEHPGSTVGVTSTSAPPRARPVPLRVLTVAPAANAKDVAGTAAIRVTFSSPLAAGSTRPRLSPATAGAWHATGRVLSFTPRVAFMPLSNVTLTIPGGTSGVRALDGGTLRGSVVERFKIAQGSVLRLQELLSLLHYSPLSWTPHGAASGRSDAAAQAAALYHPPAGSFRWIDHGWPPQLRALWRRADYTLFTRGLVMSFQADHGLYPDGELRRSLWKSLLQALADHSVNAGGYDYALADKTAPETFTVWHDGKVVLRSPANTGIASSPTPDGNFAVYTRLRSQVMRGTNPDGARYADLVQYIAYFHGNDAVHYMDRADYGIPQSLGCIELPLPDAAKAWPYLAYGTLVSVVP